MRVYPTSAAVLGEALAWGEPEALGEALGDAEAEALGLADAVALTVAEGEALGLDLVGAGAWLQPNTKPPKTAIVANLVSLK